MESLLGPKQVTFDLLRVRLVEQVKLRINNGEFTERGLARILGISQSQTHNVLKGARQLQTKLADRILAKLGISATELLSEGELDAALRLKMTAWDLFLIPRKPVGRGAAEANREDQKAG